MNEQSRRRKYNYQDFSLDINGLLDIKTESQLISLAEKVTTTTSIHATPPDYPDPIAFAYAINNSKGIQKLSISMIPTES
ncbi:hypothetical protein [Methanococcoides sp. FTZ1]|uniref:hypothetical protein n=1 Tax=Methanococcoides sp. FTZ1 TaxID=3439061 RepID=UPI003F852FD1